MSEEFASLKIGIEASLKDFSSQMSEFKRILAGTEEQAKKTGDSWKNMFGSFLTAEVTLAAATKLKNLALESIQAYDNEIVTLARLKVQLGESYSAIREYAEARQKATRNDSDAYLQAAQTLSMHKLNAQQILQLLPVIEDAGAKYGGLESAAHAFAYAIDYGNNRALRPWGIQVDANASAQDRFNYLVNHGADGVKGLAEQMGSLGAGPMTSVTNQLEDQKKLLGKDLIPLWQGFATVLSKFVVPVIRGLADVFKMMTASTVGIMAGIGALFSGKGFKGMAHEMQQAVGYSINKQEQDELSKIPGGGSVSGGGSLSGAPSKASKEDPRIVQAKSALETYKKFSEQALAEIDVAFKQNAISISEYFESKRAMASAETKEEIDALNVELKVAKAKKESNKITELSAKIKQAEISGQIKLTKLTEEETDAIRRNTEEKLRAAQLLSQIEDESEGGGVGISAIKYKYSKMSSQLGKQLKEIADLEKKGVISHAQAEKAKSDISKTESNNRKNMASEELQYKISMAQQELDTLQNIFQTLYELGGSKSIALFRLAQQAEAAKCIINTASATMKAWSEGGPFLGPVLAVTIGIAGALQLAKIESQQPPKMALGGMIRGPSHAGGGVNINAEGGEYIHRASAVSLYGARSMEAINRGIIPPSVIRSYASPSVSMSGRRAANGGLVGGGGATIVNFFDKSTLKRFLASNEGKDAIVNHISENSFAIRKALRVS